MKTKSIVQIRAALLLLSSLCFQQSTGFGQGALTPPGAPAPLMKSLDQIEARIAITNTASLVIISQPGSYYLTHNLTVSIGDAIEINTNGVTLDLNGFTISSTQSTATAGSGILLNNSGLSDITICNGHIRSGVTNNGSGVYSGSGFAFGIFFTGSQPVNVLVSGVSVSGCLNSGIYLNNADSTVVESCTVRTVGNFGIFASNLKNCSANDCGGAAIEGDQVSDCRGQSTGSYGVYAVTAVNCYGLSNVYYGLYTTTALNCFGGSNGSSYGLYAQDSATGCHGYSATGTGLYALIANVCHGVTGGGTALSTPHNINSF